MDSVLSQEELIHGCGLAIEPIKKHGHEILQTATPDAVTPLAASSMMKDRGIWQIAHRKVRCVAEGLKRLLLQGRILVRLESAVYIRGRCEL